MKKFRTPIVLSICAIFTSLAYYSIAGNPFDLTASDAFIECEECTVEPLHDPWEVPDTGGDGDWNPSTNTTTTSGLNLGLPPLDGEREFFNVGPPGSQVNLLDDLPAEYPEDIVLHEDRFPESDLLTTMPSSLVSIDVTEQSGFLSISIGGSIPNGIRQGSTFVTRNLTTSNKRSATQKTGGRQVTIIDPDDPLFKVSDLANGGHVMALLESETFNQYQTSFPPIRVMQGASVRNNATVNVGFNIRPLVKGYNIYRNGEKIGTLEHKSGDINNWRNWGTTPGSKITNDAFWYYLGSDLAIRDSIPYEENARSYSYEIQEIDGSGNTKSKSLIDSNSSISIPEQHAPFGFYPGTQNSMCPPRETHSRYPSHNPREGSWDNSTSFDYAGRSFNCQTQPSGDGSIANESSEHSADDSPSFGFYPGTNHPMCPEYANLKDPARNPAYGSWDNSTSYHYNGTPYGCRTQKSKTSAVIETLVQRHEDGTRKCPTYRNKWGTIYNPDQWGNMAEWCIDGSSTSSCETFAPESCRR